MAALKPKSAEELWQTLERKIVHEQLQYNEVDGDIHDFLIACILQEPYGSTNKLLNEALELFKSKGITAEDIDKYPVPPHASEKYSHQYDIRHSLLFLSLGGNNEQSTLLKNFGCSLDFDIKLMKYFPKPLNESQEMHKVILNTVIIPHYNHLFPNEKLKTVGGRSKRRKLKRKSRKY